MRAGTQGTFNCINVGYALFFAMNMAAMWGSTFPFMPAAVQTPENLAAFFYPSFTFEAGFFCLALLSYRMGPKLHRWLVPLAAVPYLIGWLCLVAFALFDAKLIAAMALSGLFLGWGTAGFFLVWQQVFAASDLETSCRNVVVGTMLAACIYVGMSLIDATYVLLLVPCALFAAFLACALAALRRADLSKPCFTGVPAQHATRCRHALRDYWRSAFCVGTIGFCSGAMRTAAIDGPEAGALVNVVSMVALLVASAAFLYLWNRKALTISTTIVFRAISPVMLVLLALVPVVGEGYTVFLAGILFALLGCAVVLMTVQCLSVSGKRGIQPVLAYGLFAGCVWALHDAGSLVSTAVDAAAGMLPFGALASITIFCACAVGVGLFVSQGGFHSVLSPHQLKTENIELMRTAAAPPSRSRATSAPPDNARRDRLAAQGAVLKERYFLTDREAEIAQLVTRGFTVKKISETLTISENTVRTHMKKVYEKLDIHTKTELVSIVEAIELD